MENRASGFRGFETAALAAERDNAYVTLHGAFDSEAARWSSQYRLDHMMAGIARTGSLPLAPHRVSPQMPTAEARELAEAIAQGVIDRGQAPAPPGWPQGIPVVGGAASSVAV